MEAEAHPVEPLIGHYRVGADELALFIDESGDARLNNPANRLFILAACAALGGSMDAVAHQWLVVRNSILGDTTKPLHFAEHSRRLRRGSRQSDLIKFFNEADIGRIAVCITEGSGFSLSSEAGKLIIRAAFDELLYQEARLINRPISRLLVVFEDSVIMRWVYELCRELSLRRSDGSDVPVVFRFADKKAVVPWLEMADAVAHTFAGTTRNSGSSPIFSRRHDAIFSPSNNAPAVARRLAANFIAQGQALSMTMKELETK